jgi:hypothetical protein
MTEMGAKSAALKGTVITMVQAIKLAVWMDQPYTMVLAAR